MFSYESLNLLDRKPIGPVVINRDHPIGRKVIHFYLFNEYGTVVRDLAESQVNGTLNSGMSWAVTDRGRAIECDGSTGRIDFTSSTDMSLYSSGFSILTRVNPDTFSGSDQRVVYKAPGGPGSQYAIWMDIGNTCWASATFDTAFRLADNNASTVDTGVWQDVALTFDYSNVQLWKDGVSYQSVAATSLASTTGAKYFCANNGGTQEVDGKVEFIIYFDGPLSAPELLSLKYDAYQLLKPITDMIRLEAVVAGVETNYLTLLGVG